MNKLKILNEYIEKHRGVLVYYAFKNNADYDFEILEMNKRGCEILDAVCVNGIMSVTVRGCCFFDNIHKALASFENIIGRRFTNDYKSFIEEKYNSIMKII